MSLLCVYDTNCVYVTSHIIILLYYCKQKEGRKEEL